MPAAGAGNGPGWWPGCGLCLGRCLRSIETWAPAFAGATVWGGEIKKGEGAEAVPRACSVSAPASLAFVMSAKAGIHVSCLGRSANWERDGPQPSLGRRLGGRRRYDRRGVKVLDLRLLFCHASAGWRPCLVPWAGRRLGERWAPACAGATGGGLQGEVVEQVGPAGVGAPDQVQLPASLPCL